MNLKIILVILSLALLASCNKGESGKIAASLKVGDCLDQALSPFVLQVAAVEGETIFFYHLGEMGKKIYQKPRAELLQGKNPFSPSECP